MTIPAPGASPSYMPCAASGESSRNGAPGSSRRSTRSRGSSLPRDVCRARAFSPPPMPHARELLAQVGDQRLVGRGVGVEFVRVMRASTRPRSGRAPTLSPTDTLSSVTVPSTGADQRELHLHRLQHHHRLARLRPSRPTARGTEQHRAGHRRAQLARRRARAWTSSAGRLGRPCHAPAVVRDPRLAAVAHVPVAAPVERQRRLVDARRRAVEPIGSGSPPSTDEPPVRRRAHAARAASRRGARTGRRRRARRRPRARARPPRGRPPRRSAAASAGRKPADQARVHLARAHVVAAPAACAGSRRWSSGRGSRCRPARGRAGPARSRGRGPWAMTLAIIES